MKANIKFEIILGILIFLLLLGGGLIAFVYFNKETTQKYVTRFVGSEIITQQTGDGKSEITKVSGTEVVSGEEGETVISATVEKKEVNPEAKAEGEAKNFTKNFTERFGSFSNQNDFENIRNVMIYMTPDMKAGAEKYIKDEIEKSEPGAYYGITTNVLNVETQDFNNKEATFKVKTQRKETSGVPAQTKNLSQTANIKLKNEAGSWKVDEFTWL